MTRNLVIISAGKFARETYGWAMDAIGAGAPWSIKGFLDSRSDLLDPRKYPEPILGPPEDYSPSPDDIFLCAIGDPVTRRRYTEMMLDRGGEFATLIHPTALVGRNVNLGRGVVMGPFSWVGADATLGDFATIGPHCACSHDNVIGAWCQMSGYCCLGGNVSVAEMCFFGMSVTVVPGVRIGAGAFLGVGSVVLRNVRAGVKVFGNPAVVID